MNFALFGYVVIRNLQFAICNLSNYSERVSLPENGRPVPVVGQY